MEDYAKGELHYLNRHAGQENLNIIQLLQDIHGTNTLLEITQGSIESLSDCWDAESLNFQAPLNEAEGEIAKEQKQLIQRLIAKNWTPNQIIYEIERIYGMDAFIKSRPIIDVGRFLLIESLMALENLHSY